jgi:hypothetical protein
MMQEMHAILTKPSDKAEELQIHTMRDAYLPHKQRSIAAYSLSDSAFGESSGPHADHGTRLPLISLYATSVLPHRKSQVRTTIPAPRESSTSSRNLLELPVATVALNNERRAFGAKEYEAFKQRHAQPKRVSKPSFLTSVPPTSQELQACIPHIFQSTAEGKQQTQELKNEISRWTQEFSRFVHDDNATQKVRDECILTLLEALDEAVDSSTGRMRQLFYETSDLAGFTDTLNQVETVSKSVRVVKAIEDFHDAKEEWEKR